MTLKNPLRINLVNIKKSKKKHFNSIKFVLEAFKETTCTNFLYLNCRSEKALIHFPYICIKHPVEKSQHTETKLSSASAVFIFTTLASSSGQIQ